MLPSVVAAVLSVGVVTRKSGDLAEGDDVRSRIVALAGAVVVGSVGVDAEGLKGKGIVCVADNDREERIWTTVVGMKGGWT